MNEARALRVLQDGGMVVPFEGGGVVYRDQDQRRKAIGTLEEAYLAQLLKKALLVEQGGDAPRLIWAGEQTYEVPCKQAGRLVVPDPRKRKTPARTALEHILRAEEDTKRQAYLASAAQRFQLDIDALHRGQTVTMNWDFVPRGKTRMGPGREGMGETSLNALHALSQLEIVLSKEDLALLQAVLILERSIKQVLLDFDMSRVKFARAGLNVLMKLARAYDRAVVPVSDQL